jgi:hypothetical protein
MTSNPDTTNDLKIVLIEHLAEILDDLEMNDSNEGEFSDRAIVEMHERNIGLSGFLIASLGLSDASKDDQGYLVRVNPEDPQSYVDRNL